MTERDDTVHIQLGNYKNPFRLTLTPPSWFITYCIPSKLVLHIHKPMPLLH